MPLFGARAGQKEALAYLKEANKLLRRVSPGHAMDLLKKPLNPKAILVAVASSRPVKKDRGRKYAKASAMAGHACLLLSGARFKYIRTAAADGSTPLANCILFDPGDKALAMDRTAWRVRTERRDDGRDIKITAGTYDLAADNRTLGDVGAVPVVKYRGGRSPIWIPADPGLSAPGLPDGPKIKLAGDPDGNGPDAHDGPGTEADDAE